MKHFPIVRVRNVFRGILLAGLILLLCFSMNNIVAVDAQVLGTETPVEPEATATPVPVSPEPGASPTDIPEPTVLPSETAVPETPTTEPTQPAETETVPAESFNLPPLTQVLSPDGLVLSNGIPPLVVIADPNPAMQGIKITSAELDRALSDPAAATATFSITYLAAGATDPWGQPCLTFPNNAKTAFNAAAAIWAVTIKSSVPISIVACWAQLASSSILGYSGGGYIIRDFTGAPKAGTWYDSSLANALAGSDIVGYTDMYITYNSLFSWYLGTDANPPSNQYDLVSVAAHEIAHGLNFSGSADYSSGQGSYGFLSYPYIYDTFMESNGGTKLTSYTSPSASLGSLLTSNSLWFNGTYANSANGGSRVKIYGPGAWAPGSSYSHLDYNTFAGTINSLMVYAIAPGSANHATGPVTLGILKDLGWHLASDPKKTASDFDGDGKADPVKYIAGTHSVSWLKSSDGTWGILDMGTDSFNYVSRSDFDGDGMTDPAMFVTSANAVWYRQSTNSAWNGVYMGPGSYTYVPGSDFDGDGKTDPALFLSSANALWYQSSISGLWNGIYMGPGSYTLVNGSDFDGDGITDPALFVSSANALWYVASSTGIWNGIYMGPGSYQMVAASDFDGDGKTDPALFIDTTNTLWYIESSTSTWHGVYMGSGTLSYIAGCDFNGDGKTDPAIFIPATNVLWYLESLTHTWIGVWMGSGTYTVVN